MRWVLLAIFTAAVSAQEAPVNPQMQQASDHYRAATAMCEAGRYEEAEPLFRLALAEHRALGARQESYVIAELHSLGLIARKRGDFSQSLELLNESLTMNRARGAARPTVSTLIEIANTYRAMDKPYDADPIVREAIEMSHHLDPPDPRLYATACNTYGALHLRLEDVGGASRWFQRALTAAREVPTDRWALESSVMANLATVEFAAGNGDQALALFRQSIAMQEEHLGPNHPKLAETLASYASVLRRLEHKEEAAEARRRATRIRNSLVPPR